MCYDGGQACLFIGKLWIQLNRNYSFSLQSTPATTEEGRGEEGGEGGHCGPSWRGARRERRARTCRRSWLPARWSDERWEGRQSWPAVWRTWASTSSCGNKTAELYQVRSVSSFSSSDNNWSFHISAGSLLVRKDARIRLSVTDTEFSLYLSALTLEVERESKLGRMFSLLIAFHCQDASEYTCEVDIMARPISITHKLEVLVAPRVQCKDSKVCNFVFLNFV